VFIDQVAELDWEIEETVERRVEVVDVGVDCLQEFEEGIIAWD
jgi:hypothetical protein